MTIDSAQILDAARAIFLERGSQATTAQVAERAGVSEGTLFKRFKTKAALFQAAMSTNEPFEPPGFGDLDALVGTSSVEENLTTLATTLIGFFERMLPLAMLQWSNPRLAGRLPEILEGPPSPPLLAQQRLAAYLDGESKLGRVTLDNPHAVARAFLGALNAYVFFEMVARTYRDAPGTGAQCNVEKGVYVKNLVRMVLRGIEPRDDDETIAHRVIAKNFLILPSS